MHRGARLEIISGSEVTSDHTARQGEDASTVIGRGDRAVTNRPANGLGGRLQYVARWPAAASSPSLMIASLEVVKRLR